MSKDLHEQLRAEAEAWRAAGLERTLTFGEGVDFTTNDYLGLAGDARIAAAAVAAAEEDGVGCPSARLLRGNLPVHRQAEAEAAHWMGTEAALLLPSGWQANLAMLTTLAGAEDVLFCDALNHASLIDGSRLSRARVEVFAHNDVDALRSALARHPGARRRIVVVEDVYSMDGDRAPLAALLEVCAEMDAYLIRDMAHAAGLFPQDGLNQERVLATMFTGGKALGLAGGFACASQLVIDTLINRGRSFVFTTAVPPMLAAALRKAMQVVQAEPEHAQTLFERASLLRERLQEGGIESSGEGPIVPVRIGDAARAMQVAEKVRADGFEVRAVRPPTVPPGTSRLRIVVHAAHTPAQIEGLAASLVDAMREESRHATVEAMAPKREGEHLFVCGTDTDVGKTVVSALLVRAAVRLGLDTRYWKPVQTGLESDTETVLGLAQLDPAHAPDPAVHLPLPASVDQAARDAGTEVHRAPVLEQTHQQLRTEADAFWILEGAGGLRVPWNTREDQADYLQKLAPATVLVARSGLGTLNHTLLTIEAMAARRIPVKALFLVGQPHPQNRASLEARLGDLPIFEVPWFKDLQTEHLDFWLEMEPGVRQLFPTHR
ncbi:MAG: dethiobiotin synthase [Planctomycetota bacterium]